MSLHDDIMNLQCNQHFSVAWKNGHKQARHDAAELAIKFEQQRDELLAAAKNLRDVKGRYHSEQAMKRLIEVITKVEQS